VTIPSGPKGHVTRFDAFLMVDWSAAARPRSGRDAVWIVEGLHDLGGQARLVERAVGEANPPTRSAAEDSLIASLRRNVEAGRRVLVGFDFPFGFPAGFADALVPSRRTTPPWRRIWTYLRDVIEDDPDNANNRFEVASEINRRLAGVGSRSSGRSMALTPGPGPFWGCPATRQTQHLRSTKRPGLFPYPLSDRGTLHEWRQVELRLRQLRRRPHAVWKLWTAGAVGSQTLVGIPVLDRLLQHVELRAVSAVWPFQTGLSCPAPVDGPSILYVEIWPGVLPAVVPALGEVLDHAQMRCLVERFSDLDRRDELAPLFRPPTLCEAEATAVQLEEGWILGI
jgi:precorrin-8X/cobalt-precorrin-8 methylmutase